MSEDVRGSVPDGPSAGRATALKAPSRGCFTRLRAARSKSTKLVCVECVPAFVAGSRMARLQPRWSATAEPGSAFEDVVRARGFVISHGCEITASLFARV